MEINSTVSSDKQLCHILKNGQNHCCPSAKVESVNQQMMTPWLWNKSLWIRKVPQDDVIGLNIITGVKTLKYWWLHNMIKNCWSLWKLDHALKDVWQHKYSANSCSILSWEQTLRCLFAILVFFHNFPLKLLST